MSAHLKKRAPYKMPANRPQSATLMSLEGVSWSGRCRVCGQTISGSVADLKAHVHGNS